MSAPGSTDLKAAKREADRRARIDRDLAAIWRVLRVHSGAEFEADDFPTLSDGVEAWHALSRLRADLGRPPLPAEHEQGHR